MRQLKLGLVNAFSEACRAVDICKIDCLPTYHQLRDVIHTLAAGSSNAMRVHQNVNKPINKAAGLDAGQRRSASLPQQ